MRFPEVVVARWLDVVMGIKQNCGRSLRAGGCAVDGRVSAIDLEESNIVKPRAGQP